MRQVDACSDAAFGVEGFEGFATVLALECSFSHFCEHDMFLLSLVIPSSDENGNVEINDGVYENVVIKPFMGTIRNKASRDNVDVDEILGATLIVEAGHLKKSQISKDYNDNLTEESKYYQLYNQYVDYRYNYRKEMGQPVDETVFNNSANINPRLNRINSKRKKQYGQN